MREPPLECKELLERHNRHWGERLANWRSHAAPPWWEPDLIVTPELRGSYEKWLPIREFMRGMAAIGRKWLPAPEWLPLPLRRECHPSLPDLWADLPEPQQKRLCFAPEELLPFFCALADPPQFGTISGRYPEELELIQSYARPGMRILDIGCGVGLNTLEIAAATSAETVGLTSEWLEVWMANHRCLPHDPARELAMRRYPRHLNVAFCQGQAGDFSFGRPFDLIVCNGLVGGRFFHRPEQYAGFLASCRKCLAPGGRLFLANRFHEGARRDVEAFMLVAASAGFPMQGNWRLMHGDGIGLRL